MFYITNLSSFTIDLCTILQINSKEGLHWPKKCLTLENVNSFTFKIILCIQKLWTEIMEIWQCSSFWYTNIRNYATLHFLYCKWYNNTHFSIFHFFIFYIKISEYYIFLKCQHDLKLEISEYYRESNMSTYLDSMNRNIFQ